MRQIVGLGVGLVAFTHGPAGSGTLAFSGFVGFAPARLMVVSNVTQGALLYATEKTGVSGAWSSVTSTGGTLTLDIDTSTHADTDLLRCIYEDAEVQAMAPQRGGNLWPIDLGTCALASGNTRTADYGPGPRPGTRSTRFVLAGDNEGVNTGALTLIGRTDGALFGLAVEIKGSGTLEFRIRAVGVASGMTETVGTLAITADSTWRRYILRGYVAQFDCSTIQAEIRATGSGATIEAYGPDFRLLDIGAVFPEYQPPNGVAQVVTVTKRASVSLAGYGDSLWAGASGISCRPELQRLLLGAPVYNGGIGGQTSTEIKDRFIADAAKLYRSYGIVLIWAGQNNASAYDTVMNDIAAMVAMVPHGRFLVLCPINGPTGDHTTGSYNSVNTLWKQIKRRYGNRFVDVLMVLRAGLDYVPSTYLQDNVHPNLAGHGIVAQEIYKAIVRNGWLDGVNAEFKDTHESGQVHQVVTGAEITGAIAATTLLEQGFRMSFRIVNKATTGILYINFSWSASPSIYTAKLNPGEVFEFAGYHGQVTGYWTVADGNARVTEII